MPKVECSLTPEMEAALIGSRVAVSFGLQLKREEGERD
jgi:hypothetical protein